MFENEIFRTFSLFGVSPSDTTCFRISGFDVPNFSLFRISGFDVATEIFRTFSLLGVSPSDTTCEFRISGFDFSLGLFRISPRCSRSFGLLNPKQSIWEIRNHSTLGLREIKKKISLRLDLSVDDDAAPERVLLEQVQNRCPGRAERLWGCCTLKCADDERNSKRAGPWIRGSKAFVVNVANTRQSTPHSVLHFCKFPAFDLECQVSPHP